MGITKSGREHDLMGRLWALATDTTVKLSDRLPKPPPGQPPPNDLKDSPNQRALRRSIWCLEAALNSDEKAWNDAVARALAHFDDMQKWGHMSDGDGGRTEIFTASHRQLWYAAMAAYLWAGELAANHNAWDESPCQGLINEAVSFWRLETAVAARCFTDNIDGLPPGRHMLVAGARDGVADKPSVFNPACDEVVFALVDGWVVPPRTPRVGSYSAVVPLLKKAFAVGGTQPTALVGNDANLARIPARLGWHLVGRLEPRSYYTWFDNLGFVYDGLHGAGYVDGKVVLKWAHDEATAYGEALQL